MDELIDLMKSTERQYISLADNPVPGLAVNIRSVRDELPHVEGMALPGDLKKFWSAWSSVTLFEDGDYGQWGLHFFSVADSRRTTERERSDRPSDFLSSDLVLAEFLGDLELLVMDRSGTSEKMLIALPLESRAHWPVVGDSLTDFLNRYVGSLGRKIWESSG
ncbi:hypothetical protein PO878_00260 [Iamia majanohamensis]|uniref:Knr4/Smi1-like domain-containing protein n=1 Tax=Iamia majanohamensis TaxID=467976 RepID=A0AAE9YA17_9ACTN|nr:hypothetical protein [Iamia majanohamensis]WCO67154.1 hypothetical protein PO878_00260 [Iamia majanohamensis]